MTAQSRPQEKFSEGDELLNPLWENAIRSIANKAENNYWRSHHVTTEAELKCLQAQ